MSESFTQFETFKSELSNALKSLIETQNSIKQELFLIRNKQAELAGTERKTKAGESSSTPTTSKPNGIGSTTSKPPLNQLQTNHLLQLLKHPRKMGLKRTIQSHNRRNLCLLETQ